MTTGTVIARSGKPAVAGNQRGAVLVVSVILLVLITLIGITGMQVTTLQERMAGNLRDRNMAFQGAEAGLRVGESWLEVSVARRNAAQQYNPLIEISPELASWDGSSKQPTEDNAGPEYALLGTLANDALLAGDTPIVFHVDPPAFVRLPGAINLNQAELECQRYYPVSTRAVGGTDTAVVVLRSSYIPRQSGMVTCPNE